MIHLGARSNASPFSRAPSPRSPRNNTALGNPRSPHGTQGKGKRKECHHCGLLLALRFTSPHGERPAPSSCIRPASPFQFTLPHGERQPAREKREMIFDVSIHAPAWGATRAALPPYPNQGVSIHAPAWGATSPPVEPPVPRRCAAWRGGSDLATRGATARGRGFQFTLPHGERLEILLS